MYTRNLAVIAGLVLSLHAGAQTDDRGYLVQVGQKIPAGIVLQLTTDTRVHLDSLRGKVVLLQFTASWCGVCRKEMPYLEKDVWQAYRDKGLLLYGVDRDEPVEVVKKFAKDIKVSYPLALDPGAEIFARFAHKNAGVTRNVLIDREGKIIFLTRLFDEKEFAALLSILAKQF